jgi:5-methylcytosine-specific restriction endonuclease McrA
MAYEFESFHRNIPDEELLDDLRRTALASERESMTTREYDAIGKFRSSTITARFGAWTEACAKAGLLLGFSPKNPSEEDLFRNIEEVWIKLGRQPRYREIRKPLSKFTISPYRTRYDTWENALAAFVTYINEADTSSEAKNETSSIDPEVIQRAMEPKVIQRGPRKPERRLMIQVLMRDKGICQHCRLETVTDGRIDYHIDHIKPWAKGGLTVLENLQVLCSRCNLIKGDLDLTSSTIIEAQNVEA